MSGVSEAGAPHLRRINVADKHMNRSEYYTSFTTIITKITTTNTAIMNPISPSFLKYSLILFYVRSAKYIITNTNTTTTKIPMTNSIFSSSNCFDILQKLRSDVNSGHQLTQAAILLSWNFFS
jgi:hypothetical protein